LTGLWADTAQAQPFAYISNSGSNTVSVINTATNTVVATVSVGANPFGVAVTPDGSRVYVTNEGSNTVSVIDTATNTVTATVPVGDSPAGVAVNPAGTSVYVANRGSNTVSVIETATNTVVATVRVGNLIASRVDPVGVAVNPDGSRVYVTNGGGNRIIPGGTVSVIDTATNTQVALLGLPFLSSPTGIAVNPAGTLVYLADTVCCSTGATAVSVIIATATNTVTATVPVGDSPARVAVNPAGTRIYVANNSSHTVSVLETVTNTVVATVPVGSRPFGVAVNPTGTRVFVANHSSDNVSVIDTETNTVVATVPVGTSPLAFGLFISPLSDTPMASAAVSVNANAFRAGETALVGVEATNPTSGASAADLYLGVLMPDGHTILSFSSGGGFSAVADLTAPESAPPTQAAPPGFSLRQPTFLEYTFPDVGVPTGTYLVFASLIAEGKLLDNKLDPGDVLAFDSKSFTYDP
jgi:YVTN family beta-propeller protein